MRRERLFIDLVQARLFLLSWSGLGEAGDLLERVSPAARRRMTSEMPQPSCRTAPDPLRPTYSLSSVFETV